MKTLGVIGGVGPLATAYFLELVVKMTDASCDQEHPEVIIFNCPSIPDRTSFLLKKSNENPVPPMVRIAERLEIEGASYIAIPCITAHSFYSELTEKVKLPIINMIDEAVMELKKNGISRAGIMATDGTIFSGFFQRKLEAAGIKVSIPSEASQDKIETIIYKQVKAGKPVNMKDFSEVQEELREKGAEVIILGCTELSLIKKEESIGQGFLDPMEALARKSVELCCGRVKEQYQCLIC